MIARISLPQTRLAKPSKPRRASHPRVCTKPRGKVAIACEDQDAALLLLQGQGDCLSFASMGHSKPSASGHSCLFGRVEAGKNQLVSRWEPGEAKFGTECRWRSPVRLATKI